MVKNIILLESTNEKTISSIPRKSINSFSVFLALAYPSKCNTRTLISKMKIMGKRKSSISRKLRDYTLQKTAAEQQFASFSVSFSLQFFRLLRDDSGVFSLFLAVQMPELCFLWLLFFSELCFTCE